MVEFKDEQGKPVKPGLVNYKGIYHLTVVEVTGVVRKSGEDFFLDGKSVYVRTPTPLEVVQWEKNKEENRR